jgi:hypothetical protein
VKGGHLRSPEFPRYYQIYSYPQDLLAF